MTQWTALSGVKPNISVSGLTTVLLFHILILLSKYDWSDVYTSTNFSKKVDETFSKWNLRRALPPSPSSCLEILLFQSVLIDNNLYSTLFLFPLLFSNYFSGKSVRNLISIQLFVNELILYSASGSLLYSHEDSIIVMTIYVHLNNIREFGNFRYF